MKITEKDYQEVSRQEGIGVAELKTIMAVESRGAGHLPDGRPKVLFEGHKFYAHLRHNTALRQQVCRERPDICHARYTNKYYRGGAAEWERLAAAIAYDREAALKSASWGAFQILGENHRAAGFATVQEFVNAMYRSEREHLVAVCRFIKSWPKQYKALLNHDWETFARCYNGPAYKTNGYDRKLREAYARFASK